MNVKLSILKIIYILYYLKIAFSFLETVVLDSNNSKKLDNKVFWKVNDLISMRLENTQMIAFSLWFKIKLNQSHHNSNTFLDIYTEKDVLFFGMKIETNESKSFLQPIFNEGQSAQKIYCEQNEWQFIVISIQQQDEILISNLNVIDQKLSQFSVKLNSGKEDLYKQLIISLAISDKILIKNDINLYLNKKQISFDIMIDKIINNALLQNNCENLESEINLLKLNKTSSFSMIIQDRQQDTIRNMIKQNDFPIIVSLNLYYLEQNKNINTLFNIGEQFQLLIENNNINTFFIVKYIEQQYYLGLVEDISQQIVIQIEYEQLLEQQYFIQYYSNEILKGQIKIGKTKSHSKHVLQGELIKLQQENILIQDLIILRNFKIKKQSNDYNLQNKCLLFAILVSKEIKNQHLCIIHQIQKNIQQIQDIQITRSNYKRNLSSVQYISGVQMNSLVKNIYTNSQFKYKLTQIIYSTYLFIGYFKLTQTISNQYLPLITLGIQSDYYNFLNLYIKDNQNIELKYTHDTNNIIAKQSQTLNYFQNQWICLGIAYSKTNQQAKIIYSDINSQLFSSSIMSSVILPTSYTQSLEVCITCKIEGGVFGHFEGQVSTVKIVYEVNYANIETYYLFNEATDINKSPVLNESFNINNYISNSEYDVGKGFLCNSGYTFFEGVCIYETYCKSTVMIQNVYSSFEIGKFIDSQIERCLNCSSNCLKCTSSINCTSCRPSYKIQNSKCIKCDNVNSCNSSCTGQQVFDPMNQICIDTFDIKSQILLHPLLSSRIITDNFDVEVINSPPFSSFNDQIVHCYMDVDNNPSTLHSFLGGEKFSTSTVIKRSWQQIPKGYQKSVSFYVLFYGSGNPSNLSVKINQISALLDNSYSTIILNKISCSGSGAKTQSIYQVKFTVQDYQDYFNLEIQSKSTKWGIRNINIEILKCHPSCGSCKSGGNSDDCTTCDSNLIQIKFQCICPLGKYAKYQNCFNSSCVVCETCSIANCQKCEDITGNCTLCSTGYSIKDGLCILNTQCISNDIVQFQYCGVQKEIGFTHFKQNRIVQYADYWRFYNNDVYAFSCISKKCAPILGNNNQHTLEITLPNYQSYHYQLNLNINLYEHQSIDQGDYVNIYDGNNKIFTHCYNQEKKSYSNEPYNNAFFLVDIPYLKDNDQIQLKYESQTNDTLTEEAQSFSQIVFTYGRCHPLCKTCTSNTISSCISCIDNSTKINGNCQCNEGFYFYLIRFPTQNILPGSCQKCNPACKQCTGPSYRDCISCKDEYTLVDGSCQYNCQNGQYWDQNSLSCLACHICCRTCQNGLNTSCHDCKQNYSLRVYDKSCMIYNAQCQSCTVAIKSLCGGNQNDHNQCLNSGWVVFDENTCVDCSKYVNGQCGGYQSQNVIDFCIQSGFYNYDNQQCSSCKQVISHNCGRNEIKDQCKNSGWAVNDSNVCINCNPNSLTFNQCKCHSTCQTCSQFFDPSQCIDCKSQYYYFNKQCLLKCPNGHIADGKICVPCTDEQMPKCISCFKTCLTCDPFVVSTASNYCTSCSSQTRSLVDGQCKCLDLEDSREIFFECSYQTIAVLNVVLSNIDPLLYIDFGKQLNTPNNFEQNQFSWSLCKYLFTDQTLSLLGSTSKCSINGKIISVDLGQDSLIFNGDLLYFNKNILSFNTSSSTLIQTYMNNKVIQDQIEGQSKVLFNYISEENSCSNIAITFNKIVNDAKRGFKEYDWSLIYFEPKNQMLSTILENLIQKANFEKKLDLLIPKGIIKIDTKVKIVLNYTLKANIVSYEEFILSVKPQKKILLDIQSPLVFPYFKQQSGIIVIQSVVKICDPDGDYQIIEPIDFQIVSEEFSAINYQNSTYQQQDYTLELKPYTLNTGKIVINVFAKLVSDSFIDSKVSFQLHVQYSQLYVKIAGGNSFFNYKDQIVLNAKVRDYDIQSQTDNQGIDVSWKCVDSSQQNECVDKFGKNVVFPLQNETIKIEAFTFNPYTVIKILLIGQKFPDRVSTDSITILLSELDQPYLDVQIKIIDPKQETVNLNEEIYIELDYKSNINVDLLSFSGTIYYENQVVGIIKFDYTKFKFQIWNYYSDFKRDQNSFQIRFSVFNPQYYMPSMFMSILNLNFPPNNCKLIVNPINGGYSIETKYLLQFQGCEDENQPIQYQFFYYRNLEDFEYEKQNPQQVKRRQLNDRSQFHFIETNLPSGQILILAQAIDSKYAIFNATTQMDVLLKKYDEQSYIQILQQKIDQINKFQANNTISELAIICDDILQRNDFKQSSSLNQIKIDIIYQLSYLQQSLSFMSSFSTAVDKGIISLIQSGITYDQKQQKQLITYLINELDQSSNLQLLNLDVSKEKLKQKLYDSFQVIDTIGNSGFDTQSNEEIIELTDKIGHYFYKNILPNEEAIYFKGQSLNIFGIQMTEKYICNYFLCSNTNSGENKTSTSIFNFKKSEFIKNPYTQDESFQNYTNSLKNQNPNIPISQYPVITPKISTQENYLIESFSKQIMLSFSSKTPSSSSKNMACLTKNKDHEWKKEGCQNVFDQKSNSYLCLCDELQPTTIIEDLESLIVNKNIETAFSSDGIKNILSFKDFYKYVVFWILLFQTIFYYTLYKKGFNLDILDSKSKLTTINNLNKPEQSPDLKSTNFKNKIIPQNSISEVNLVKCKENKNETMQTEIISNFSPIIKQAQNSYYNSSLSLQTDANSQISPTLKTPQDHYEHLKVVKKNSVFYEYDDIDEDTTKTSQQSKRSQSIFEMSPILQSQPLSTDRQLNNDINTKVIRLSNRRQSKRNIKLVFTNEQSQTKQRKMSNFGNKWNEEKTEIMSDRIESFNLNSNVNIEKTMINKNNHSENKKTIEKSIEKKDTIYLDKIDTIDLNINTNTESNNTNTENNSPNTENNSPNNIDQLKKPATIQSKHSQIFQFTKGYNSLPTYKQILIFHDFLGIFYIYNPLVPRTLRFLIFYVRSIHSLGIAVVFDQNYFLLQKIALAVFNAISVIIVVKVLDKFFSLKSIIGQVISRLVITSTLFGYYYIILSIVSGQTSSESNQTIATFGLFFCIDILIISFISAVFQRYIAKYIIRSQKISGVLKFLYQLIQLELIIISLS